MPAVKVLPLGSEATYSWQPVRPPMCKRKLSLFKADISQLYKQHQQLWLQGAHGVATGCCVGPGSLAGCLVPGPCLFTCVCACQNPSRSVPGPSPRQRSWRHCPCKGAAWPWMTETRQMVNSHQPNCRSERQQCTISAAEGVAHGAGGGVATAGQDASCLGLPHNYKAAQEHAMVI